MSDSVRRFVYLLSQNSTSESNGIVPVLIDKVRLYEFDIIGEGHKDDVHPSCLVRYPNSFLMVSIFFREIITNTLTLKTDQKMKNKKYSLEQLQRMSLPENIDLQEF